MWIMIFAGMWGAHPAVPAPAVTVTEPNAAQAPVKQQEVF